MEETSNDKQLRPLHRRHPKRFLAAAGSALGVAGLAAGSLSVVASSHAGHSLAARLTAASASASASASSQASADQAAIAYVDAHFPGSGAAQVLQTEPDVDSGVAVYDVRVLAPDGTVYVVGVQRSDSVVLSATPAESQTPPVTSAPPTVPTPPIPPTTPPTTTKEPVEVPETPPTTPPTNPPTTTKEPVEAPETPPTAGTSHDLSPDLPADHQTPAPSPSTATPTGSTDPQLTTGSRTTDHPDGSHSSQGGQQDSSAHTRNDH